MAVINYNTGGGVTRLREDSNTSNNKDEVKIPKSVSSKLDLLDNKLDNLYKSVYISRPDNVHNTNDIINKLVIVLIDYSLMSLVFLECLNY